MDDSLSLRIKDHIGNNNDKFKTFYSQVGGHVNMKILDEKFVCKPLNRREVRFYQNLPILFKPKIFYGSKLYLYLPLLIRAICF